LNRGNRRRQKKKPNNSEDVFELDNPSHVVIIVTGQVFSHVTAENLEGAIPDP